MPQSAWPEVKVVVFDLDDTLCAYWRASMVGLRQAFARHREHRQDVDRMVLEWGAAYRGFGPNLKSTEWYNDYLHRGEPTRTEQMSRTLGRVGIKDRDLAKRLSETYAEARNANLALFPEAREVLEALTPRYRMALLTNGPADIQRQEIATLGIGGFFEQAFIEGEMGVGKPHRSVFQRVARDLEAKPSELLMVGNSYLHDIHPASRAGWRTVWIRRDTDVAPSLDPRDAMPEERPEGMPTPDLEIGDLRELLPPLGCSRD